MISHWASHGLVVGVGPWAGILRPTGLQADSRVPFFASLSMRNSFQGNGLPTFYPCFVPQTPFAPVTGGRLAFAKDCASRNK